MGRALSARSARSPHSPLRRRVVTATIALGLAVSTITAGCSSAGREESNDRQSQVTSRPSSTVVGTAVPAADVPGRSNPVREPDPHAFDATNDAFRARVTSAGLAGGVLYVVRTGDVVDDASVGSVDHGTPIAVASAAKWFTSALLLVLVDDGKLSLDEPISRRLPEFTGDKASITLRELLNHTSGLEQQDCIWNTSGDMGDCVARLARGPLEFAPGTAFSYGNAGYHVAGHLAEVVTGTDFQTLFDQRLGEPLGLTATSWGGGSNPSPAAGVTTTVDDYARFLEMMLKGGVVEGRRILSEQSVAEIQRDQVVGMDTSNDYAVGITRIPTYGLGLWRDVVDEGDTAIVVSGNGAYGFYPWIDHENNAYGVLAVEDRRGAELAVPASQAVVDLALEATPLA